MENSNPIPVFAFNEGSRVLEERVPFKQSMIWKWQKDYYVKNNIHAWQDHQVPYYATNNVALATRYAKLIWSYMRDLVAVRQSEQTVYMIEWGAGIGKLAFHILQELDTLALSADFEVPAYCYILTDISEDSLQYWATHPQLLPFIERGVLDVGLYDLVQDIEFTTRKKGVHFGKGTLTVAPFIIANYLVDTIPQSQFYIKDRQVNEALLSIAIPPESDWVESSSFPSHLDLHYDHLPVTSPYFEQPELQAVLDMYTSSIAHSYVLVPDVIMNALLTMHEYSAEGFVFLAADKGFHRLEEWDFTPAPLPLKHGSFSFNANFHALDEFIKQLKGWSLFPNNLPNQLDVGLFVSLDSEHSWSNLRDTYRQCFAINGPDDLSSIESVFNRYIDHMEMHELISWLRLSHYDSYIFRICLPRLHVLATVGKMEYAYAFLKIAPYLIENWFPLQPEDDIYYEIACLLYNMEEKEEAAHHFQHSIRLFGKSVGALFNLALCFGDEGKYAEAIPLLQQLLVHQSDHQEAQDLLQYYSRLG